MATTLTRLKGLKKKTKSGKKHHPPPPPANGSTVHLFRYHTKGELNPLELHVTYL